MKKNSTYSVLNFPGIWHAQSLAVNGLRTNYVGPCSTNTLNYVHEANVRPIKNRLYRKLSLPQ